MGRITGFLYAEPSSLEGMRRLIDLGGTMTDYNMSPNDNSEYQFPALQTTVTCISSFSRLASRSRRSRCELVWETEP